MTSIGRKRLQEQQNQEENEENKELLATKEVRVSLRLMKWKRS